MRAIASQAKADDEFVLMSDRPRHLRRSRVQVSLPGPDISATELAALLDKIPARELVVDMTSSSGGSIPILEKPKRVIITATKTGNEKISVVIFPRYFIEALRDPAADADKNETISALEAFKYARGQDGEILREQNHLATEHALLEDAGKGDGVKDPSAENGEGLTATRFTLIHLGSVGGASPRIPRSSSF